MLSFHNILQWNCNGFYAHIAELKLLITEFDPFLICIQESRFKPNHIPTLNGYSCVYHNHDNYTNASGGVLICLKSEYHFEVIDLNTHLQVVAIKVYFPISFTICNIYLPPNQQVSQFEIESVINDLPKPFLLLGDMNAHSHVWGSYKLNPTGKIFENILLNTGLVCLNNGSPTRFNPFSSDPSAIDLTISTPNLLLKTEWFTHEDLHHSDHYPIIIRFSDYQNNLTRRSKWLINDADWSQFYHLTNNPPSFSPDTDINHQVEELSDFIVQAANCAIPKTSEVISKRTVPWWNDLCKSTIKNKRKMLKVFKRYPTQDNLINYNKAKAIARKTVLDSKSNSWKTFVSSINDETPPSVVFNKISKISGIYRSHNVASLLVNDQLVVDKPLILNELGKTLAATSSSENYSANFLIHKNLVESSMLDVSSNNTEPYNCMFSLHEVNAALNKCKGSSPGPDNIHYDMIKRLHPSSIDLYLKIVNRIWVDNVFPDTWRNAIIIPILKPEKPSTSASSYRPISLTSCLVKLFEGMVNSRLTYLLESRNYLHNLQYGFRKGRSTIDPTLTLESEIQNAFILKKHCLVVFFDIKRAYDMVWRFSIIQKLHAIGLRGNLMNFLNNFTNNRTFNVMLGNLASHSFSLENGIPQGSKISVTLFLIVINDILECIQSPVNALLYADDLTIYVTDKNLTKAQNLIQSVINKLMKWSEHSGFQFAAEKMSVVHFHRFRKPQPVLKIYMNSVQIKQNDSHKLLGIWFDDKLTFKKHVDLLYKNCIKRTNILKILSNRTWGSDENVLLTVYKSIIRSRLEYGCAVFSSAKPKILQKLQVLQNMCLRLVTGTYRTSPILSLHALTGLMPLNYRRHQITLSISNRISANPTHPLYKLTTDDHPLQTKYSNRKFSSKPFSIRAHNLLRSLDVPLYTNPITMYRTYPPWSDNPIEIIINLTKLKRSDTSAQKYQTAFNDILTKYANNDCVYTDGSLDGNNVGCAIVHKDLKFMFHLPNICSISTAELYAIYKAVKYTHEHISHDTLIISDSLSSIQSLNDAYSNNYIVQLIQTSILTHHTPKIRFLWVPSHMGIDGNEEVDKYARESFTLPITHIDIPSQNMNTYIKDLNIKTWKTEWTNTDNNKLRCIKNDTNTLKYTNTLNRREKTVLNRLLIGHCNITHKFIFDKELPPHCHTCDKRLTVEHILVNCNELSIPKPGQTLTQILGNTNERAVATLLQYLKENNLLNKI